MNIYYTASKKFHEYLRALLAIKALHPQRFYAVSSIFIFVVLFAGGVMAFTAFQEKNNIPHLEATDASRYRTISVELLRDTSLLIPGTVLSNETANIYPRREGIVEDIFVDIGDEVKKGQVVARLLPQGVEGQGVSKIAEKSAMKAQTEADFIHAQSVALESVSRAEQQFAETLTALEVAKREQDGLIKKIAQSAEQVVQMRDQAFIATRDARQFMERVLLGSNARTGIQIRESDILQQIGALSANHMERYEIVSIFNALYAAEQSYEQSYEQKKYSSLKVLLTQTLDAFLALHNILTITTSTPIPQPGRGVMLDPTDITNSMHTMQDKVLKAKENWENAVFSYEEMIASEPELYNAYLGKKDDAESNKVKLLNSQLDSARSQYNVIGSQQKQMVEYAENSIRIADASLRAESALSGNNSLLSPFSGIISKRFVSVGEIVMPSRPAFELVDVPTSLGKKSKTEIQFGLPEYLIGSIIVGDTIAFLLPGNDTTRYEAVITRKSPQVDIQTHTITIQARIDDALSLPHNTNVRVRIEERSVPTFRVPSYAVKREEDHNAIWILDPATDEPLKRKVTVIAEDGEFAEISGDITAETLVILDPPDLFVPQTSDYPPSTAL